MPGFISDRPLARGLIAIGDEAIAREDAAKIHPRHDIRANLPGGFGGIWRTRFSLILPSRLGKEFKHRIAQLPRR